jgi:hypothetical protein
MISADTPVSKKRPVSITGGTDDIQRRIEAEKKKEQEQA